MPTRDFEPIKPLVDELAAELKVRSAQEDASVPAADNGYLYERRFAQGAQYPLIVRRKDAPGAERSSYSTSAHSLPAIRTNISSAGGP